mmetsp:Transcript_16715/g.28458  ORF Transcript_16715/g.28458 Transcript_16715/m.28458 type:complete len:280 (+) Transcript_16715:484-1323(+)
MAIEVQLVDFSRVQESSNGSEGVVVSVGTLKLVQVGAILWTHHHRMALLCRLLCQVLDAHPGAPEHHHGVARQRDPVVHRIVPDHCLASQMLHRMNCVLRHDPCDALDVAQPVRRHEVSRNGGARPLLRGHFVSAHMKVVRVHQLRCFSDDIRDEMHAGLGWLHGMLEGTKLGCYLRTGIPQLGICGQHCLDVTGRINLRDDFNMQRFGICNDASHLVRSIRASITHVVMSRAVPDLGAFPPSSNLCEFWIFLVRNAPALVIRQVPMKAVHLEGRHGSQ